MQKQLVSCIKSLAIVSFDNNVKQALHLERERVFKIEEAARLKRLAEEMASGGFLRVPQPAYFSAGGLADQIAMASAYDNMIPIPFVLTQLSLLPTKVAINTGGTEVKAMSSLTSRRL